MFKKVCSILEDIFEQDASSITPQTSFDTDLYADLQDMQELFMIIEEEFDIQTDEADIPSILTVGDLCSYIESNIE